MIPSSLFFAIQLTDIVVISHVGPAHTQEKTTQADNSKGRGAPEIDLIEAERITYGNGQVLRSLPSSRRLCMSICMGVR
jgi:hypothetical protein